MFALVAAAAAAFALQVQVQTARDTAGKKDVNVSISVGGGRNRHGEPRRIPVTPAMLRTAFHDSAARTLLLRARRARMSQDSALVSYDAMSYQRVSAGLGIGAFGRDRLMFRREEVAHVRWQRGVGAWVRLEGARTAIPIAPPSARDSADREMNFGGDDAAIPYYPGYETLWIGGGVAKAQVDEREIIHPLAEGAEAYYTYASGDSMSLRLPDGSTIHLRELKVRPRRPAWNVVVGSLWFDVATGQLVRAAFRLAIPMDIWAVADEEAKADSDSNTAPGWVKGMLSPMRAEVTAVAIEYGLYNGRFWLPRLQSAEGDAQVSFLHVPFSMEQSYTYASVNARDSLPPIAVKNPPIPDSLPEAVKDSIRRARRDARRAERDSVRKGLKPPPPAACDTGTTYTRTSYRFDDDRLPVAYQVPCDQSGLASSPLLPRSIYDPGEAIFGSAERDALIQQALSLSAQAQFAPLPPTFHTGLDMMRFNRIEGFSLGGRVDEQFGDGYSGSLIGRLGTADLEPNVELAVSRSNGARTIGITGYNHLVAVGDWGDPLSFGSSLSALLFGRDEGFYYRASGVALTGRNTRGLDYDWRLFAEQERSAAVKNHWSLGAPFMPNITARRGAYAGGAFQLRGAYGEDPQAFRLLSDVRLEAATGDSSYGRGSLEVTASDGFGPLAGALTVSGGSSVGAVPAQRLWYLGGARTVRGQRPDTLQRGNAYWLARAELGLNRAGVRPSVFGDFGWTGDRRDISRVGRPLSGVGAGVSFLDGLIRFDAARGLYPRREWRMDLYLEARF